MSNVHLEEPLVSVIIPVYNAAKYVRETLDCVCGQTLRQIEIICVDDGSTDDSLAILQEYAAKDERVRILQQKNQYAGVARNNGMAVARGKYLSFLDADDLFEPDMLEAMSTRADKESAEMIICHADCFQDGTSTHQKVGWLITEEFEKMLHKEVFEPAKDIPDAIFQLTAGVPWNRLFLREFVQKHKLQWATTQNANDFGCVYHAMVLATRVVILKKNCVHYRIRHDSIAHAKHKPAEALLYALKDLKERICGSPQYGAIRRSFYEFLLNQLAWHMYGADEKTRNERAELYMKSYEPLFGILQLSADVFHDAIAYKRLMAVLRPSLSIIVQEQDSVCLGKCLNSLGGFNTGSNEILCACAKEDAEKRAEIEKAMTTAPGIRVFPCSVAQLPEHARTNRITIIPPGMMLKPACGHMYSKLDIGKDARVDISPILMRIRRTEPWILRTPDRVSFRLFGKGVVTKLYTDKTISYWILGKKVFSFSRNIAD